MQLNRTKILLLAILLLAFFLRLYKVTEVPPSLNWDEASIGYNAYSVLKTGRDEWGQFMPIHFKSYGEYKLPAQIYASIPGIFIFGLNELGVRITPVIYGTLTVLLMFFLGRAIFASSLVGLISAFLLAISPWHIHLTRGSFESSFAVMWVVLGILLLVKGFEDKKWLVWSMVPFAISVFTYNSARVFTPLFLLAILLIYYKTLARFKRTVLVSAVVFTVLLLPITPYILSGERSARFKLVSITDDPGLIPRINERRGMSNLPKPLPRLIHNKVTYVSFYFGSNYLAHFSPQFLFISGAPHKQHHVQNIGQLYLFQAPFLLLGLYLLFKKKNRFRWLLLSWILLIHIPVAITNDSIPHALRTAIAAPFYQLITALGLVAGFERLRNKQLKLFSVVLLFVVVLVSMAYYLHQYFVVYPVQYSRDWQYGYKQVVEFIGENYNEYDQIVFSRTYGEPHMFTLFYLNYPPNKFQNDPKLNRFETFDWVRVLNFDKFYFPDLGDQGTKFSDIVSQNPDKKLLFIGKPGDFPKEHQKLLTVDFLLGTRVFEIVEIK
jgi:4-amino-4-deoxy-L-arabinose transferase-like glycosyltransferase